MKNQTQVRLGQKKLSEVVGGQHLTVTKRDGKTERVFVRELPIEALEEYAAVFGNEARELDVICDKPAGWSRTLSQNSFLEVMEAGKGNRVFFTKVFHSRVELAKQMDPLLAAEIDKRIAEASGLLNSPSKPPSS
jgi:hypothetical protein